MAATAFSGAITALVDGVQYSIQGDWKIDPNTVKNERRMGAGGEDLGFIVSFKPAHIEGELADHGGLSVQGLAGQTGVTITTPLVNGKVYTLVNANWAGESTIDAKEGKVPVRWESGTCLEKLGV